MALVECPRCELNYMNDTDTMCSVCRREVRGESEQFEMIELCSECGENPVIPGQEVCAYCLKEILGIAAVSVVIVPAECSDGFTYGKLAGQLKVQPVFEIKDCFSLLPYLRLVSLCPHQLGNHGVRAEAGFVESGCSELITDRIDLSCFLGSTYIRP